MFKNHFKKNHNLCIYPSQFSGVTPVTGSQSLFAIFVGLLHFADFESSFITLSTSLYHFISGLPLLFLPSGDQLNICLDHPLFPMRILGVKRFNFIFSIFSRLVCVTPIFFLIISFITFNILNVLAALLKKSISVFNRLSFNLQFALQIL